MSIKSIHLHAHTSNFQALIEPTASHVAVGSIRPPRRPTFWAPFGHLWLHLGTCWLHLAPFSHLLATFWATCCDQMGVAPAPLARKLGATGLGMHFNIHLAPKMGRIGFKTAQFRGQLAHVCHWLGTSSGLPCKSGEKVLTNPLLPVVSTQIKCRSWHVRPLVWCFQWFALQVRREERC